MDRRVRFPNPSFTMEPTLSATDMAQRETPDEAGQEEPFLRIKN